MRINNALQFNRMFLLGASLCFFTPVLSADVVNNASNETSQTQNNLESAEEFNQAWTEYHGILDDYQKEINMIEDTYGVYDKRLIKPLTGLGLAQKGQSNHFDAIETFKRAEHLTRVNEGLYHLKQLPILDELVDSYSATSNWEMAGRTQLHVLQIQQHNYPANDIRLVDSMDNLANWYLYRHEQSRGLESIQVLLKARTMNIEIIKLLESEHGQLHDRLAKQLDELAKKNYQLDQYQKRLALGQNPSLYAINKHAQNAPLPNAKAAELSFYNPYLEGKKALIKRAKVFEQNPDASMDDRVDALLRLGDWYLIFGQKASAVKAYRQAYNMSSDDEQSLSRLDFLFSQPRKLQFDLFYASEHAPSKPKQGYVDAVFEVSGTGKARKIEIVDFQPVDFKNRKLRKMILAARFRPRMVDGNLVATEGVSYRHNF